MKVLLLEDDIKLAQFLVTSLSEVNYQVEHASTLPEFQDLVNSTDDIGVLIMDRLIGNEDSKTLLPKIRALRPSTPIIMLSAISTPNEKTDLLNLGVDDYMGKPFATQEFIARIRALLRRSQVSTQSHLRVGNLMIDSTKRTISVDSKTDLLPSKEFLLLHTLSQQKGRVWSKYDLLESIWGQTADIETNVVEATIANIRKRLHDMGALVSIKNSRNVGYWIED